MLKYGVFTALMVSAFLLCADNPDVKKRAAEAKLYFEEYQALRRSRGNTGETLEKLRAALSLDPRNEEYRYAELTDAWSPWQFSRPLAERLGVLVRQLDRAKRFRSDFPKSNRAIYSSTEVFSPNMWINVESSDSREDRKKLADFLDEFRTLAMREKRTLKPETFDLSKGFSDVKTMKMAVSAYASKQMPFLYGSPEQWLNERARNAKTLLPLLLDFASKGKEERWAVIQAIRFSGLFSLSSTNLWPGPTKYSLKAVVAYYKNSEELINELKKSDLPDIQASALTLETMRALVSADRNKNKIRKIMLAYFTALDAVEPDWIDGTRFPETGVPLDNFLLCEFWFLPDKLGSSHSQFLPSILADYRLIRKGESVSSAGFGATPKALTSQLSKAEMIAMLRRADGLELRKNAASFRNAGLQFALDGDLSRALQNLPQESADKVFDDFNQAYRIKCADYGTWFRDKSKYRDYIRCLGAEKSGDTVYLLLRMESSEYALGILNGKKPPQLIQLTDFQPISSDVMFTRAFQVCSENKKIVLAGANMLLVSENGGRRWKRMEDITGDFPVRGMHLTGGRLYIMGSLDHFTNTPKGMVFLSMTLDGKDRKIIFDTRRKEPQNDFDKRTKSFIPKMIGIYGTIIFRVDDELYSYDTAADRFQKCMELGVFDGLAELDFVDGALWTTDHFGRIVKIDTADWSKKVIFIQHKNDNTPAESRIPGGHVLRPPFLYDKNSLYFSSFRPFRIDLKKPERSPLLFLPSCLAVHRVGDNVIFFNRKKLFLVKSK